MISAVYFSFPSVLWFTFKKPCSNIILSVWSQLASSTSNIRSVFSQNENVSAGLKKFTLNLATPATESIGWDFKPDEDYLTGQLRKLLIAMSGNAGNERQVYIFVQA